MLKNAVKTSALVAAMLTTTLAFAQQGAPSDTYGKLANADGVVVQGAAGDMQSGYAAQTAPAPVQEMSRTDLAQRGATLDAPAAMPSDPAATDPTAPQGAPVAPVAPAAAAPVAPAAPVATMPAEPAAPMAVAPAPVDTSTQLAAMQGAEPIDTKMIALLTPQQYAKRKQLANYWSLEPEAFYHA